MSWEKRGQIEITFNWIYIVIAGAVILLFFFSLVVKQKQISEERLSNEVVQIMSSILTGAGVSEKTKNFIDASGLADYILYFSCDAGISEFGIKDKPTIGHKIMLIRSSHPKKYTVHASLPGVCPIICLSK